MLDIHAGILPLELTMLKVCHRLLVQICTLPKSHPLHQLIHKYHTTHIRKDCTLLHNLLDLFPEIHPDKIETITPNPHSPAYIISSFTTEIAQDRDTSIHDEAINSSEIKVFTDGSGIDRNIGVVVVMYRKGRSTQPKTLRYHLVNALEYTSFKVEAVGAILGIWLIRTEHIAGQLPILTDSEALIKGPNHTKQLLPNI